MKKMKNIIEQCASPFSSLYGYLNSGKQDSNQGAKQDGSDAAPVFEIDEDSDTENEENAGYHFKTTFKLLKEKIYRNKTYSFAFLPAAVAGMVYSGIKQNPFDSSAKLKLTLVFWGLLGGLILYPICRIIHGSFTKDKAADEPLVQGANSADCTRGLAMKTDSYVPGQGAVPEGNDDSDNEKQEGRQGCCSRILGK